MTGAEHYREAQRLLSRAARVLGPDNFAPHRPEEAAHCVAMAQVHATLALAAATYLGSDVDNWLSTDNTEWLALTSGKGGAK